MSPYHEDAKAEALKATYHSAEKTLEEIAEHDIIIFSGNAEGLDQDIHRIAEQKIPIDYRNRDYRSQQAAQIDLSKRIKENIPKHAKAIEEALTAIGYEKGTIYGYQVYTRKNGDNLEILAGVQLHLLRRPTGVCLYRVPLDYDGDHPLGPVGKEKQMYKKKYIAGSVGSIGTFTATIAGIVLLDPSPLALICLVPVMLSGIYALINADAYNETSDHEPAFTGKDAFLEAVKPTAEHHQIMNPVVVEETKEPIRRPRIKDYLHTPVIDFLKGKGPKVRIEIDEEEEEPERKKTDTGRKRRAKR